MPDVDVDLVVAGLSAGVFGLGAARLLRRVGDPLGVVAVVVAVMAWALESAPLILVFGVGLFVLVDRLEVGPMRPVLAVVALGVVAVALPESAPTSLKLLALPVIPAVSVLVVAAHHALGSSVTLSLVTLSGLGIWAAVPDTEQAALVVSALLPLTAAAIWSRHAEVGVRPPLTWGVGGLAALLWWAAAVGSRGRPPALGGAAATVGVLVLGPWWLRRARSMSLPWAVAVHVPVVAVAARVAGVSDDAAFAWAVGAAAVATAAVAGSWRSVGTPRR